MDKLYVDFEVNNNLDDFIMNFFSKKGCECYKSCNTYYDKECKELQCENGKYRSFDEFLICVNTYFPEVTYLELFDKLLTINFVKENKRYIFYMVNCTDIDKSTILFYDLFYLNLAIRKYDYISKDDSKFLKRNIGKYTWFKLFEESGITSEEELKNKYTLKLETKNEQIQATPV